MHNMKQAVGQRGGIIGAGYDIPGIDVSPGERLVHVTGGLLARCKATTPTSLVTTRHAFLRPAADSNGDSNSSDQRHATVQKTALTYELTSDAPHVGNVDMGQQLHAGEPLSDSMVWVARHPARL